MLYPASFFLSEIAVSFRVGDEFWGKDIGEDGCVLRSKERRFSRVRHREGGQRFNERALRRLKVLRIRAAVGRRFRAQDAVVCS